MSIQQMLLGASGASGYLMDKSLRFRASASAYLNRTPASATNRRTWTLSCWVKRGSLGTLQGVFTGKLVKDDTTSFFYSSDKLNFLDRPSNVTNISLSTDAVYRDPSAWYHVVLAADTTNATSTDRIKIYVNNTRQTLTGTYPSLNYEIAYVNNTQLQAFGVYQDTAGYYYDGYLAEVNFIDGQALTSASFGETNALTGVWQPAPYTGTYGTNGFYLDFEDTSSVSALGTDKSGNGNTWTVNNISLTAGVTYDSMTDVPTLTSATAANCCVMNPLNFGTACSPTPMTVAGGNLNWSYNRSSSGSTWMPGTIQVPPNSKIYFEFVQTSASSAVGASFGICYTNLRRDSSNPTIWRTINAFNGNKFSDTVNTAYGTSFAVNDICGVAVDLVNGKIFFSKNGTWQGSADPVAGTNAAFTDLVSSGYSWLPVVYGSGGDSNAGSANFGQRPFAFSPPTGFVALNTFNLPTSTIVKGNTVMDATLYTGNASTNTITNAAGFRPDFVWYKARALAYSHQLFDSVRGVTKRLVSNSTAAENTQANYLTSFNSDGFTIGNDAEGNTNASSYVAWQWQAGQGTTSSNTDGSITSTVSVNAAAGFSVVTYTGNAVQGATVGHGLGVAPTLVLAKNRSIAEDWRMGGSFLPSWNNFIVLNSGAAVTGAIQVWNDLAPTSSVVNLGNSSTPNGSGNAIVLYCWAQIDGFSSFGKYTGTGANPGPFIYTGFQPKYILLKSITGAANWYVWDTIRNTFNSMTNYLSPSLDSAESSLATINATANGFSIINSGVPVNASGTTYLYIAYASNPFKNSLAF